MDMRLRKILRDFINWQRHKDILKDPLTIDYELAESYLEITNKQLSLYGVVSSAYMVKVEGNGTMIILAENIADACDKLEIKGYKNYTFVKSTSLDVLY